MSSSCCATLKPNPDREPHLDSSSQRAQLILSFLCLFFLLLAWGSQRFGPEISQETRTLLYLLAYLTGGYYPVKGVLADLRRLQFNVNFLMVAAAVGAAVIGELAEGSILMFLFSLSGALESYASGRSQKAIRSLIKLSPEEATLLKDGKESIVPASSLAMGDVIIVLPGERFPADGIITEGSTSVDESSLTGEAMPVDRTVGDRVLAGTINRFGVVKAQLDRPVTDTTLAKIFRIIEESKENQAPAERLIEKYGGPYTWIILSATILTFLGGRVFVAEIWQESLYRAMTLMVVASPCALVLSIPSAVLASMAAGAWNGILFKGGHALEMVGKTHVFAFDKTGTLTRGKPELKETRLSKETTLEKALALVASVEQNSEHPIARVFVQEAGNRGLTFARASETQIVPGMGIEGRVHGKRVRIGSEAFLCLHGAMEEWVRETLVDFRTRGLTCLVAAVEGKPLAVFGIADTLRPGSGKTIDSLESADIRCVMLTGDNASSAGEFARQLGIKDFRAGLLPHQKVKVLQELATEHGSVAMVGDGVNDAPALITADVGIAMGGSGSDAALENATIVLMGDDIERIPEVIFTGRRTRRIIHQNLVFALCVIVVLIISTFSGWLTLAAGVVGHEGSTLLVVFNSLRLLRWRKA
jgi:Zn2+/Cd2+-exporting ATPase